MDLTVIVSANSPAAGRDILNRAFWNPQNPSAAGRDAAMVELLALVQSSDLYQAWNSGIVWNGADSSPTADPDADGLANLLENSLAENPLLPDIPPLPALATGGPRSAFRGPDGRLVEHGCFQYRRSCHGR